MGTENTYTKGCIVVFILFIHINLTEIRGILYCSKLLAFLKISGPNCESKGATSILLDVFGKLFVDIMNLPLSTIVGFYDVINAPPFAIPPRFCCRLCAEDFWPLLEPFFL